MMALNVSLRDARLEAMRGNTDKEAVKPKATEPAPAPAQPAPQTIDMAPVAEAISQGHSMMAHVAMKLSELPAPNVVVQASNPPSAWTFKITERDRMGNIVSFTAVPK